MSNGGLIIALFLRNELCASPVLLYSHWRLSSVMPVYLDKLEATARIA